MTLYPVSYTHLDVYKRQIYGGTDVAQSHVFLFIFVCEPFTVTITQVN